jgi:sugar phosphate isomerase/epimerase
MQRRTFLSGLSGLAAVPTLTAFGPTHEARSTADRSALRLGAVTYNIAKDWDLSTLITKLAEAGFEGVELRTMHRHGVEPSLSSAARTEVRRRFGASSVKLGGLGTVCEYQSSDPAIVRKNIEETKAWVKLARDVGSPSVKVRPNGVPKEVPEERTLEQIGKALNECAAFAQDYGVTIQLEVHGETTSRLPRIRTILDHAGNAPSLRVCWNSNPTDLLDDGFDANFRLVRDRIGQVHMRDLFEEYPWRRLFASLAAMSFDGYCFAEIPESTDPVRVLKYFKALFRAYQDL